MLTSSSTCCWRRWDGFAGPVLYSHMWASANCRKDIGKVLIQPVSHLDHIDCMHELKPAQHALGKQSNPNNILTASRLLKEIHQRRPSTGCWQYQLSSSGNSPGCLRYSSDHIVFRDLPMSSCQETRRSLRPSPPGSPTKESTCCCCPVANTFSTWGRAAMKDVWSLTLP